MNLEQRNQVISLCANIEHLDVDKLSKEIYPQQLQWETVVIGGHTLSDILSLLKRVLTQLKSEIKEKDGSIIPFEYTNSTAGGPSDLAHQLTNILNCLNEKAAFDGIIGSINWLISYQIAFGFWNKSTHKLHDISAIELNAKRDELNVFADFLQKEKSEFSILKKSIDDEKVKIDTFKTEKEKEFAAIIENFNEAGKKTEEISRKWQQAVELEAKIKVISESSDNTIQDLKKQLETQSSEYEALKKIIVEFQAKTEGINKEIEKTKADYLLEYTQIQNDRKYIDEKKLEIEQLAGFAADTALGHSFNKRKKQLTWATYIWLAAFGLLVIGTAFWLYLSFTLFKVDTGSLWANLIMNALKTVPAFIILGFAARQYGKERNLQEEYAFKQAIAVTVKAYADQIHGEADGDRRKLMKDTIEKMYTQPKIVKDISWPILSIRGKEMTEVMKRVADSVDKFAQKP